MSTGICPNCGIRIEISNTPKIGQQVICKKCRTKSILVWLHPIELDIMDNMISDGEAEFHYDDIHDYDT